MSTSIGSSGRSNPFQQRSNERFLALAPGSVGRRRPERLWHEVADGPHYSDNLPAENINHTVWLYHVFGLSPRRVELLLTERGVAPGRQR